MPMIDLITPYYDLGSKGLSSCRLVNWRLANHTDSPTKSKMSADMTQGATLRGLPAGASGRCRGNFVCPVGPAPDRMPRLVSVYGTGVWRWDALCTTAEQIGTVSDNGSPVTMTCTQFDLVVCDGTGIYTRSMTLEDDDPTRLVPVDLPEQPGVTPSTLIVPTHVVNLAQRIVCNSAYNSNQWFYSELPKQGQPLEFKASSFYTAEGCPDIITAVGVTKGTILLLGTRSSETWASQANRLNPFSTVGGTALGVGTEAPYSLASSGDLCFFLGSSATGSSQVFQVEGTSITKISNNAIEETIAGFDIGSQRLAIGHAWTWTGETYYALDFPSMGRTYVWGSDTGTWHERMSWDLPSAKQLSWRYRHPAYVNGKIYMGINDAPGLISLEDGVYQEHDGNMIKRELITAVQWDELNEMQIRQLTVDCDTGTTPTLAGQDADPKLLLETSNDGGYTYGPIDDASVGRQGEYGGKVTFGPQGMGRSFTFHISFSANAPLTLWQGRLDYAKCGRT